MTRKNLKFKKYLNFVSSKLLRFISFAILLLTLQACNNQQTPSATEATYSETWTCQPINTDALLQIPLNINYLAGRFFIPDFRGERMIHEIWLDEPQKNLSFATRGSGPVEFTGPLGSWEYNNQLYVFDRRRFKLGKFEILKPDPQSIYTYQEIFSTGTEFSKLVSINENTYLGSGHLEEGRYAILNNNGSITSYVGTYPGFAPGEESIPFDAKAMFHQVNFSANYERNKIAAVSTHVMDIIDFAQIGKPQITRIKLADYKYQYSTGSVVSTELESGFDMGSQYVTSCNKYIYILYRAYEKINSNSSLPEIHIYDWHGNFIKKHPLTCNLFRIKAIATNELYGLDEENTMIKL